MQFQTLTKMALNIKTGGHCEHHFGTDRKSRDIFYMNNKIMSEQ